MSCLTGTSDSSGSARGCWRPLFRRHCAIHISRHIVTLDGRASHASSNRHVRRTLLQEREINIQPLTNIDWIDAALCALAAHHFLSGSVNTHGDVEEGFIVVPG